MKTITNYPAIDLILEASQDVVDDQVLRTKLFMQEHNLPFTDRDEEYCRLETVSSLIKALANYLLPTDDVKNISSSIHAGNAEIMCQIIRNGETHFFHTYTIIAEGEIQRAHYRYLVKSDLRKLTSSTALDGVKATQKRMKAEDRLLENIKYEQQAHDRYIAEANALEAKTDEQIITEYNSYWIERFGTGPRFEYLNEGAQQCYGSEEAFIKKCEQDQQQAIVGTKQRAKTSRYCAANCLKAIKKYQTKLENL